MENWSVRKYYRDVVVVYRPAWGMGVSENTTLTSYTGQHGNGNVRKYYCDGIIKYRPARGMGVSENTTVTP